MTDYLIRKLDDIPPTHAVVEQHLPAGEIWLLRGFAFVPPELGAKLGEPDDAMAIGTSGFPAWRLISVDAEDVVARLRSGDGR